MNPAVWLPVKVMIGNDVTMHPGKKELEYFVDKWVSQGHKAPFTGEYNIPISNDARRLMTIDPSQVSHCITDIDMSTYDDKKATVMCKVRFSGPTGDDASDECMANKVRFVARSVKTKDEKGNDVDRLITFDLIHAPKGVKGRKSLIK